MRKLGELDQAMDHLESRLQVCKIDADHTAHEDDQEGHDGDGDHPNAKVTSMKEFVNVVILSDHG